jgi:hypothetical protein
MSLVGSSYFLNEFLTELPPYSLQTQTSSFVPYSSNSPGAEILYQSSAIKSSSKS